MTVVTAPAPHRIGNLPPLLVVLVATLVAWWVAAPYTVGVFHDDGIYALLARSIATGDGFHYSHLVGDPAATHYPPLYPLLLAVVWRVSPTFPANVMPLLTLNAVFVGLAALGWWRFATARLVWRGDAAVVGALVCTLTVPVLALSGALLSESLFIALLWPTLLWSERAVDSRDQSALWRASVAVGVLMLARTHGVAVLVALVSVLIYKRRWMDAAVAVVIVSAIQLPWLLWSRLAAPHVPAPLEGAYGSYLGWFIAGARSGGITFVAATARVNAHEMWLLLRDQFFVVARVGLVTASTLLAAGGMIGGGYAKRQRIPVTIVFVLVYVGIVKVWPYAPWRFMWAIWPLLLLLAIEGFRARHRSAGRWRPLVATTAAIPAFAFVGTTMVQLLLRDWRRPAIDASAQITPVVDWVRTNTTPRDVVLSEGEQVVALYTGRRAAPPIDFTAREYLAPPTDEEGARRLTEMLGAVPARYVILLAPPMIRAADMLADRNGILKRVATLKSGAVFEVAR